MNTIIRLIGINIFILSINIYSGCGKQKSTHLKFLKGSNRINSKYIKDKTLDVFNLEIQNKNRKWILKGETLNKKVYTKLKLFSDSLFGKENYIYDFDLLPDSSLNDSLYGIVNVSVTPIKEKPSHSSQIIDQAKMGEKLKLLRFKEGWYLSQSYYDYIGWINKTSIQICDSNQIKDWNSKNLIRVSTINGTIFSTPDLKSQSISDIVLNNKIKLINRNLNWSLIQLPDKRLGYIQNNIYKKNIHDYQNPVQTIIKTAYLLMGTPYLWGGNSVKGTDCSGFTHNIFEASGFNLPRDARQQALLGDTIIPNDNWSNVKPGDLLFFGKKSKITHVGISIGNKDFIHQGGKVAINSLDYNSILFAPKRLETFLFIKRII